MGAIWLLSMPDVLRDAGLNVATYPGWQTRGRSTGGYDAIHAVQCHHTASFTAPANDMDYMWNKSSVKPIGAVYLARDAKVTVGAAGATNTSGAGGPLGPIPKDRANLSVISIEAANNGTGEPWNPEQQEAYLILVKALTRAYGLNPGYPGVHGHFEWTSRKIDPAGQSRWASGANKWDMNRFRMDSANSYIPPKPLPDPTPLPDLTDEEIMVALIISPPPGAGTNPPWLLHINGSTTYIGSAAYAQAVAKGIPVVPHNLDQYTHYRKAAGC